MRFPIELIMSVLAFALIFIFLKSILDKDVPSIKLMILGIAIILTGGIIVIDDNSYLGGAEYILVLAGLVVTLMGFSRYDT